MGGPPVALRADELDAEFVEGFWRNAQQVWVTPELERRKSAGTHPSDFRFYAFQVVFDGAKKSSNIRFNEEVRGRLGIDLSPLSDEERATGADEGSRRVTGVRGFELARDEANCGHVTWIAFGDVECFLCFDLRYNSSIVADFARVAPQFLDAAEFSLDRGQLHAFVESLWSGVELMAKGELLMTYETDPAKLNGHDKVQARYNMVKKFGCVPERFAKLYSRLNEMRGPARYLERPLNLTIDRAKEMLSDARDMHCHLSDRVPERGLGVKEAPPSGDKP